jgi:hypothetical protein
MRDTAIFDCGHAVHLSCLLKQTQYGLYACPVCTDKASAALKPNLGKDREIAMQSTHSARVRERQLFPPKRPNIISRVLNYFSPLTPVATTFQEHVHNKTSLKSMKTLGFTPADAIQDRVRWRRIQYNYTPEELMDFGFQWDHMVSLGIEPQHINAFSWNVLKNQLKLDSKKLLQLNISISELATLNFTCAQYHELGFDWPLWTRMGANVETLRPFNWSLQDIKTYWSPSVSQWIQAGFYDRKRLMAAGWPIEDARNVLPSLTQRNPGRSIRLNF